MKKIVFSILFILTASAFAQEMSQVSNFRHNQLLFNPAAAGINETELNLAAMWRLQWTALGDGAPNYQYLWADYKLNDSKSAFGLNMNRTTFGVTRIMEISGNYSYQLRLNTKWKLGMGLRFGGNFIRVNELPSDRIWDAGDPFENVPVASYSIPAAGTGFRLYSDNAYAGIAAPDLISMDKNNVYGNKGASFFKKKRNYSLLAGYVFPLSDAYRLSPNLMVLYFPGGQVRTNVNLNFEIRDYFWAGLTYSSNHFHSAMVGTHISSTLKASYAYQFGIGKNIPGKFNTHEISLILNLDTVRK